MPNLSEDERKNIVSKLENMGVAQVRILLATGGWATHLTPLALEWLKSKEDEEARLQAVSQAEMASTSSRAASAAERAASAAEDQAKAADLQTKIAHKALVTSRFAVLIAAIALVSTVVAYLYPRH